MYKHARYTSQKHAFLIYLYACTATAAKSNAWKRCIAWMCQSKRSWTNAIYQTWKKRQRQQQPKQQQLALVTVVSETAHYIHPKLLFFHRNAQVNPSHNAVFFQRALSKCWFTADIWISRFNCRWIWQCTWTSHHFPFNMRFTHVSWEREKRNTTKENETRIHPKEEDEPQRIFSRISL